MEAAVSSTDPVVALGSGGMPTLWFRLRCERPVRAPLPDEPRRGEWWQLAVPPLHEAWNIGIYSSVFWYRGPYCAS
jgi:hypothetical protein